VIACLLVTATIAPTALAHPADKVVQAAYLTLAPGGLRLELDLTSGELVANQFLGFLDQNTDGQIGDDEISVFAERVIQDLSVRFNGQVAALHLESKTVPDPAGLRTGEQQVTLIFAANLPNVTGENILHRSATPTSPTFLCNRARSRFSIKNATRTSKIFGCVTVCMVLFVIVGNTAHLLQVIGWLPIHPLPFALPSWSGLWFGTYATLEGISLQVIAVTFVIGSYFVAEGLKHRAQHRKLEANDESVRQVARTEAGQPELGKPQAAIGR
jgi:hypothetical protein